MSKHDPVRNPAHYALTMVVTADGEDKPVTPIELIRCAMTDEQFEGHCLGTTLAYLLRYKKKNGLEDLEKAHTYLGWMIEAYGGEALTVGAEE